MQERDAMDQSDSDGTGWARLQRFFAYATARYDPAEQVLECWVATKYKRSRHLRP